MENQLSKTRVHPDAGWIRLIPASLKAYKRGWAPTHQTWSVRKLLRNRVIIGNSCCALLFLGTVRLRHIRLSLLAGLVGRSVGRWVITNVIFVNSSRFTEGCNLKLCMRGACGVCVHLFSKSSNISFFSIKIKHVIHICGTICLDETLKLCLCPHWQSRLQLEFSVWKM